MRRAASGRLRILYQYVEAVGVPVLQSEVQGGRGDFGKTLTAHGYVDILTQPPGMRFRLLDI